MRNTAIFLATTAIALIASSTHANAEGLYVSVFGGLNFQPGSSGSQTTTYGQASTTTTSFSEDADTGFVVGGVIGGHLTNWVEGLRAEVEVSYRRNDREGEHHLHAFYGETEATAHGPILGNTSNFAVMANVWYDIEMGWKAKPYVGGGAGWARSQLEAAAPVTQNSGPNPTIWDSTEQHENGFAFQLGAGVNYNVAPGVDIGLGYRYFNGPNFDPIFIGKNSLDVPFDNENHSVAANLTISIN